MCSWPRLLLKILLLLYEICRDACKFIIKSEERKSHQYFSEEKTDMRHDLYLRSNYFFHSSILSTPSQTFFTALIFSFTKNTATRFYGGTVAVA